MPRKVKNQTVAEETRKFAQAMNNRVRDTLKLGGDLLTGDDKKAYQRRLLAEVPSRFKTKQGWIKSDEKFSNWLFGTGKEGIRKDVLETSIKKASEVMEEIIKDSQVGNTYTGVAQALADAEAASTKREAKALRKQAIAAEVKQRAMMAALSEDDWDLVYDTAMGDYPDIVQAPGGDSIYKEAQQLHVEGIEDGKYYDKNDSNFWGRVTACANDIRQALTEIGIEL